MQESNSVTMTAYLKQVPHKHLDPVKLYAEIQKIALDKLKTPPTLPASDSQ